MKSLNEIFSKAPDLSIKDVVYLLNIKSEDELKALQEKAYQITTEKIGNDVFYRGIVEFSNICILNCDYCGIRRGNNTLDRFMLTKKEVVDAAMWSAQMGYGSCVLQSGERKDKKFTEFVIECVKEIKKNTISEKLPEGLGITLSVGEQTKETYQKFFDAGAHRYLLRVETTDEKLFNKIHPEKQTLQSRIKSLEFLKEVGFQTGTGIMIGLPEQSLESIAKDILFFKDFDIDMVGMGPYINHPDTPMYELGMMDKDDLLKLSLKAIAAVRLIMPEVNIASTTALQALFPQGREMGIKHGANIIMPNLTPVEFREKYKLYDGKPCMDEAKEDCLKCLQMRVELADRNVGWNQWGDSKHFQNKQTT